MPTLSSYSQSHREYYLRNREKILAQRAERERKWIITPKGQYSVQKRKAKQRKIEWQLSFEEWWNIWQESGHWEERGDTAEKYCMSRHGDVGPYSKENVYINGFGQNTLDYLERKRNETSR